MKKKKDASVSRKLPYSETNDPEFTIDSGQVPTVRE
jgi:hypothetical protein